MKAIVIVVLCLISAATFGQQQAPDTTKKSPAPKSTFNDDWGNLQKYRAENAALPAPAPGENRVVFLGSSIFELWKTRLPEYFENHKNYIDRGIGGQISPQLLIRFQQDVVELNPKVVIILAGSNDIGSNGGHVTFGSIMNNIKSMVELAKLHNIKVILCKYLPINSYPEKIVAWNKEVKAYAESQNLILLDYFTPLADENNKQKAEQTTDGTHPNPAGYKIMVKVTDDAIAKALK